MRSPRARLTAQAGRSLDLQYYIWHDDLTGHLLAREVLQAAERGVRVRMLLDDMNDKGKDALLLALDAHPNIEIRLYNPFRNRRGIGACWKWCSASTASTTACTTRPGSPMAASPSLGGRNIGEEYFDASTDTNFRDLDVVMFGPAVRQASRIFDAYWNSDAAVPIAALTDIAARNCAILAR